ARSSKQAQLRTVAHRTVVCRELSLSGQASSHHSPPSPAMATISAALSVSFL
uniref:Uncharacterized protein n=1 Tax=Aegilops tauschii subsp. strangulata TaxID=200361 RepID=A0A453J390_AEGTS